MFGEEDPTALLRLPYEVASTGIPEDKALVDMDRIEAPSILNRLSTARSKNLESFTAFPEPRRNAAASSASTKISSASNSSWRSSHPRTRLLGSTESVVADIKVSSFVPTIRNGIWLDFEASLVKDELVVGQCNKREPDDVSVAAIISFTHTFRFSADFLLERS